MVTKRWTHRQLKKWKWTLGFLEWDLLYDFPGEEMSPNESHDRVNASVCADWCNQRINMLFYPPYFEQDEGEATLTIVHEYAHGFLDEMHDWKRDKGHEERVSNHIARAILRAYEEGIKEGKRVSSST